MKWEELDPPVPNPDEAYIVELTDVECPQCGAFLHKQHSVVLVSDPPQYLYKCESCGWQGHNYK